MRYPVLATAVSALAVFALASSAQAVSPCCDVATQAIPEVNGMACNQLGVDEGPPGCVEFDDGNCIGGGLAVGGDPTEQSPLAGCICLDLGPFGSGCISDGSTGDWIFNGHPDPATKKKDGNRECTRDAATGCVATGTAH